MVVLGPTSSGVCATAKGLQKTAIAKMNDSINKNAHLSETLLKLFLHCFMAIIFLACLELRAV
jgi:hypothetical protein